MGLYGTGIYGTGIYGVGEEPAPPPPPYVHHVTTVALGASGIVLGGAPDKFGVTWSLLSGADPWSPGLEPRHVTGDRGSAHGSWDATRYYGDRIQELSVLVKAPTHEALHHAHQRWMQAISLRPFAFTVDEPYFGRRWASMARDGRPTFNEIVSSEHHNLARATASLVGRDPLIYSETEHVATTGFPSSVGGLSWPTSWPATWDAVVESGLLRVRNVGTEDAPVSWRIAGPVTDPVVTHVETQQRFRLALEIPAGEWITVNTATRRVLAMDQPQASRRANWSGSWLSLPPGDSTIAFSGAEGGTDASLTATFRDVWV